MFVLYESGLFTQVLLLWVSMRAKQVVRLNNNIFEQNKLAHWQLKLSSFFDDVSVLFLKRYLV